MSSILFGDTMVPNIEEDYILLLGYSILYKKYYLTRFNHQKKHFSMWEVEVEGGTSKDELTAQ